MKMWAGRISQASNPEFEKWQRSFDFDQRLLPYEVRASKAHASALLHAGVLTPQECASIRAALDQIQPPSTRSVYSGLALWKADRLHTLPSWPERLGSLPLSA